jgi:hypothetical protein
MMLGYEKTVEMATIAGGAGRLGILHCEICHVSRKGGPANLTLLLAPSGRGPLRDPGNVKSRLPGMPHSLDSQ